MWKACPPCLLQGESPFCIAPQKVPRHGNHFRPIDSTIPPAPRALRIPSFVTGAEKIDKEPKPAKNPLP